MSEASRSSPRDYGLFAPDFDKTTPPTSQKPRPVGQIAIYSPLDPDAPNSHGGGSVPSNRTVRTQGYFAPLGDDASNTTAQISPRVQNTYADGTSDDDPEAIAAPRPGGAADPDAVPSAAPGAAPPADPAPGAAPAADPDTGPSADPDATPLEAHAVPAEDGDIGVEEKTAELLLDRATEEAAKAVGKQATRLPLVRNLEPLMEGIAAVVGYAGILTVPSSTVSDDVIFPAAKSGAADDQEDGDAAPRSEVVSIVSARVGWVAAPIVTTTLALLTPSSTASNDTVHPVVRYLPRCFDPEVVPAGGDPCHCQNDAL